MKQATLFTFEVDVHMSCPSCGLFFRYRNNEIPENRETVHTCEGCEETLTVPAFFIDVHPIKKKKQTTWGSMLATSDRKSANSEKEISSLFGRGTRSPKYPASFKSSNKARLNLPL